MIPRTIKAGRSARYRLCVAVAALSILTLGCPSEAPPPDPPPGEINQIDLVSGTVEPQETKGAPYPPVEPDLDYEPNVEDEEPWIPVPDGPVVGDEQPANPPVEVKEAEIVESEES